MDSWYKVTLSLGDAADGKNISLQKEFTYIYMRSGFPAGAGMVQNADNAEQFSIFFSPGAALIARELILRYKGAVCPAPRRSEIIPLVGAPSSLPFADN